MKYYRSDGKIPDYSAHTTTLEFVESGGWLLPSNLVVVDFDAHTPEERVKLKIVEDYILEKYPTFWVQATKGKHLYYRKPDNIKRSIKSTTPLGVEADYLSAKRGQKQFELLKLDGQLRQMSSDIEGLDINSLPVLPLILQPLGKSQSLLNLGEGSRNDALFKHLMNLKNIVGLDINEVANFINNNILNEPLPQKELDTLVANINAREVSADFFDLDTSNFVDVAKWVIDKFNVKTYNDTLYHLNDGRYISDTDDLIRKCGQYFYQKKSQDLEMLHQINKYAPKIAHDYKNPIVLKNGMIKDGGFIPLSDDVFSIFNMDVKYDPNAYSLAVDEFFNSVSCNRSSLRKILEEILGHVLLTDKFPAKVFFLKGKGRNGKSTFLEMLNHFTGSLSSNISLDQFNDDTSVATLIGKLVNCSDEVDASYIEKAKGFKSLASGNTISIRPIYSTPKKLKNTATLILNANELPVFKDKTDGFFRRFVVVPFDLNLTEDKRDNQLLDKLITDEAKSYLLNLALEGLDRIISNGYELSECEYISREVEQYKLDTDSVLSYLNEVESVDGNMTDEVYSAYCEYCDESGLTPYKKPTFSKKICGYGYSIQSKKILNITKKVYSKCV